MLGYTQVKVNMSDTVLTQEKRGRNTNSYSTSTRKRCWCFTINNHSEEELEKIIQSGCDYVMQEEEGKKGTVHIQGVLRYKNAVRFPTVKKLLVRAHIEPCRNWPASVQYCSKVETRKGRMWSNVIKVEERRSNGTVTLTQEEQKKNESMWLFKNDFEKWKSEQVKKDVKWMMRNYVMSPELYMGAE